MNLNEIRKHIKKTLLMKTKTCETKHKKKFNEDKQL